MSDFDYDDYVPDSDDSPFTDYSFSDDDRGFYCRVDPLSRPEVLSKAAEMERYRRAPGLMSLPTEILFMMMCQMDKVTLQRFVMTCHRPRAIMSELFDSFMFQVQLKHQDMTHCKEFAHLVSRILALRATPAKTAFRPYEDGPTAPLKWLQYMRAFRERDEKTPLPSIPTTVKCLVEYENLLAALDKFTNWFRLGLVRITNEPLGLNGKLSREENHRIRRALLLFQLYCELFHQPFNHRDCGRNGRVSEQMLFLQSLPSHIVGELDSIYGIIEDIAHMHFHKCCNPRVSFALRPGLNQSPSSAKFEYLLSHGIIFLARLINEQPGRGNFENQVCDCCFPPDNPNRFFTLPMQKFMKVDPPEDSSMRYTIKEISPLTPNRSPLWYAIIEIACTGPSYPWKTFHYPPPPGGDLEPLRRIQRLIQADPQNIKGIIFWDESRVLKAFRCNQALSEDANYNWARGHFLACDLAYQQSGQRSPDLPVPYTPTAWPRSTAIDISGFRPWSLARQNGSEERPARGPPITSLYRMTPLSTLESLIQRR